MSDGNKILNDELEGTWREEVVYYPWVVRSELT
jgi:hypothetical protein